MKTAGRQSKTTSGLFTKSRSDSGLSCTKSNTCVKPDKKRKTAGKAGTDAQHSLSSPTQLFGQEIQVNLHKATPEEAAMVPGECPQCFKKLKLQLFPVDDVTRRRLEKDKHNPYLELTLGTQKRISSVVKHLNTKWSSSRVASEELILLPYDGRLIDHASSRRWSLKDCSISAADVYTAIGGPAVFRLRYGWFPNSGTEVCEVPLTCPRFYDNLQSKENDEMHVSNVNGHPCPQSIPESGHQEMRVSEEKEHLITPPQENCPLSACDLLNQAASGTAVSNKLPQIPDNMKVSNSASLLWPDGLSNISCGALLSEASRDVDAKLQQFPMQQINSLHQQISISCSSFDAAIAAHIARYQATNLPPSTQVVKSSIWDAEETCHAFPFQESGSTNAAQASCGNAPFTSSTRNDFPDSIRFHNKLDSQFLKADVAASLEPTSNLELQRNVDPCVDPTIATQSKTQGDACEQPKTGLQASTEGSSNGCNDIGKIDFSSFESLGPWVNGVSSFRNMLGGDSISLSGLISCSRDAFHNCSAF